MKNGRLARTRGEDRVHHRLGDGSGDRNTGSGRRRGNHLETPNPTMRDVDLTLETIDPAVLLLKSDGGGRVGVGEAELARPPPSSRLLGGGVACWGGGGRGSARRPLGLYVYRCRYGQGLSTSLLDAIVSCLSSSSFLRSLLVVSCCLLIYPCPFGTKEFHNKMHAFPTNAIQLYIICHGPRAHWAARVTVAQTTVAPRSSAL